MIKFLKFLWKKCFGSVGDSRIKTEVEVVKHTSTDVPILIVEPKPEPKLEPKSLHCAIHTRFKKSCPVCQGVTK